MVQLYHKAEHSLVCGLWTHLKGCQSSLLQWLLGKTLCWHLPFRVLNARKIIWLQHKKFRATSFRMLPPPSDTWRETFTAACFQRAGSMDGTSPEEVLQRNRFTCLASQISFFLASSCLEGCATCSVQFWSTPWLLSSPEEASSFPLIPSPTSDSIQSAYRWTVLCCLSLHLSLGSLRSLHLRRQQWFCKTYSYPPLTCYSHVSI